MNLNLKNKIRWALLVSISGGLAIFGNNCARIAPVSEETVSSSTQSVTNELKGQQLGVLNGDQMFTSMLSLADLSGSAISAATQREYRDRFQSLGYKNQVSEINAPLMLSATSLSGQVCSDLINKERANATAAIYFRGVNFNQPSSAISAAVFSAAVRSLAQKFWDRDETSEELAAIIEYRSEFEADLNASERSNAASSVNLWTSTCAAMLSASDVITF